MCSVHKVIIEYDVLRTYLDAVRLMLATSEHISVVNFKNDVNNGFPADSSNTKGYE